MTEYRISLNDGNTAMESMKQIKVCVFEIVSLKSLRIQLKSYETNQKPFFSKVHFTSLKYYYTFAYPKIFDDS